MAVSGCAGVLIVPIEQWRDAINIASRTRQDEAFGDSTVWCEDIDTQEHYGWPPTDLTIASFLAMHALLLRASRTEEAWVAKNRWAWTEESPTPGKVVPATRAEWLLAENAYGAGLRGDRYADWIKEGFCEGYEDKYRKVSRW